MASDYPAIRKENLTRYGTDIGRIGRMLLADRYDDRTHFIYELLQNAEDALAKRADWQGQRSVRFYLLERELVFSHFGSPFDEADVRGICGIDESTKDITQIGRFGIGFKSVYAFTERPEIHSNAEDFAIENFVWPVAVPGVDRAADETIILMPLQKQAPADREEIEAGLQRLGPDVLLFLREIEEIEWQVEDGPSGLYLRQCDELDEHVRRVTVIGQAEGKPDVEETWLVFSRPVYKDEEVLVAHVEVAFLLKNRRVIPIPQSPLFVFFPTVVQTDIGFCVQGPYRTTPSRDNVPQRDGWNRHCVKETAATLIDALAWLRDQDMLGVDTLQCLPLDREKFHEDALFYQFFEDTKRAFFSERLLPCFHGGYVTAGNAKLARTQELRELFGVEQLTLLFGEARNQEWLSASISQDRTPELRRYLMQELEIEEVVPATILPKLDAEFMRNQSDEWVRGLYELLSGQTVLRRQATMVPIIRLENGEQVRANDGGQSQAFLPGKIETDFPTVRAAVCNSKGARAFLSALGLTEPDPVDDIIRNVVPKYHDDASKISDEVYAADIGRIINAYQTDSRDQRNKLIESLRNTPFVLALDTENQSRCYSQPSDLYLPTERLKKLFAGIAGVKLADDTHTALRGEDVRDLLEACGATRSLQPVEFDSLLSLSKEKRKEFRKRGGYEKTSGQNDKIRDWKLRGLGEVLVALPGLPVEERRTRAKFLWEELIQLEGRGKATFTARYTWTHYGSRSTEFDSHFVCLLNEREWIPDASGSLRCPRLIPFDALGWRSNPFLISKICFKPPIVDQLAQQAGFEPAALDLLQRHGITSLEEVASRLGLAEAAGPEGGSDGPATAGEAIGAILGDVPDPTPPVTGTRDAGVAVIGGAGIGTGSGTDDEPAGERAGKHGRGQHRDRTKRPGRADPDDLVLTARMELETRAIDFILSIEPNWKRTPIANPGFDLFETGPDGRPARWCEVKAMTGSLGDRPVGVSSKQFECAREHGTSYWLYVVEYAGDKNARLVRIQDPAGKARTFTFDHGWLSVAQVHSGQDHQSS